MSTKNLSTVTTELIESYGNTARNVVSVYRLGGERMIHLMDQRWERALERTATRLKPEVRSNALAAQKKFSAFYGRGIDLATGGADALIDKAVELAAKGVQQAAANAGRFDKKTGFTTLHTVATAAAPAVDAIQNIASKLEQRSGHLVNRVAGKHASVNVAAVKRVTPVKKARARKAAV